MGRLKIVDARDRYGRLAPLSDDARFALDRANESLRRLDGALESAPPPAVEATLQTR